MTEGKINEERTVLIFYNQKTGKFFLINLESKRKVSVNKICSEVTESMKLLGNPAKLTFLGDDKVISGVCRTYYMISVDAPLYAFDEVTLFTFIGSVQSGFRLPKKDRKFQQLGRAFTASVLLVKQSEDSS